MSKTEEGKEERYFYTGSAILYTRNESGDLLTENILDSPGQIIASKRFDDDGDPGTTYALANMYFFYHYDIRGSVTAIVRPDGTLIEHYSYDVFGNWVAFFYFLTVRSRLAFLLSALAFLAFKKDFDLSQQIRHFNSLPFLNSKLFHDTILILKRKGVKNSRANTKQISLIYVRYNFKNKLYNS